MKFKLLLILLALTVIIFPIDSVKAQPLTGSFIDVEKLVPSSCDFTKNDYKPYEELVVIDVNSVNTSSLETKQIVKNIYYESVFVRNVKKPLFNAVFMDGKLYFLSCNQVDVVSGTKGEDGVGIFVVGTADNLPATFQSVLNSWNIQKISQAEIGRKDDAFRLQNKQTCTELCSALKPAEKSLRNREYKIEVSDIQFKDKIEQKSTSDAKFTITNKSEYPIYGDVLPLYVVNRSGNTMYDSSWLTRDIMQKTSGILFPGQSEEVTVKLNPSMLAGKYEQTIGFIAGSQTIDLQKKVTIEVLDGNIKLARVRPRDNVPYANVRESGSLGARELFKVDPDEVVEVKKDEGAWLLIETKSGKSGWIYRPNLRFLN
jgi:hypothetical protein